MNEPEQQWRKLVKAARQVPDEPEETVSPGFLARARGLRVAAMAFAKALLWRRWSLILAAFCILLFLAALTVTRCNTPEDPLIAPPELVPPQP